jgi:hypothetical protein
MGTAFWLVTFPDNEKCFFVCLFFGVYECMGNQPDDKLLVVWVAEQPYVGRGTQR